MQREQLVQKLLREEMVFGDYLQRSYSAKACAEDLTKQVERHVVQRQVKNGYWPGIKLSLIHI